MIAAVVSRYSIVFLNEPQVYTGKLRDRELPMRYILACRFLHCGIIDRTETLDQGFDYSVLDPIPNPTTNSLNFGQLCDAEGAKIVSEAAQTGRRISVLWSGGIDSTAAFISLIRAAERADYSHALQVLLSAESIAEYSRFYERHIHGKYREIFITPPIAGYLDPACINVTGEHGDHMFGSLLLDPWMRAGIAHRRYTEVLPDILVKQFANAIRADRVMLYLDPVVAAAPVPIVTLFDYLWWLTFSLKWQSVALALLPFSGKVWTAGIYRSLRHFFKNEKFQQWTFSFHPERLALSLDKYKQVAKEYILHYTGDEEYYLHKEKEPSLGRVMRKPDTRVPPTFVRRDFKVVRWR
jgi:hypothetical protein